MTHHLHQKVFSKQVKIHRLWTHQQKHPPFTMIKFMWISKMLKVSRIASISFSLIFFFLASNSTDDSNQLATQPSPPKQKRPGNFELIYRKDWLFLSFAAPVVLSAKTSDPNSNPERIYSKSGLPPAKLFSISKSQAIDKHYDDHPGMISPKQTTFTPLTQEKSDENETSDWL